MPDLVGIGPHECPRGPLFAVCGTVRAMFSKMTNSSPARVLVSAGYLRRWDGLAVLLLGVALLAAFAPTLPEVGRHSSAAVTAKLPTTT